MSVSDFRRQIRRKKNKSRNDVVFKKMSKKVSSNKEKIDIPKVVKMHFREDYNILMVHEIILEKIEQDCNKRIFYEMEIDRLKDTIENNSSYKIVSECKLNIQRIEEEMNVVCDENKREIYLSRVEPLFQYYKSIPKRKVTVEINDEDEDCYIPTKNDLDRIDTIRRFADIAREYIPIDFYCTGEHISGNIEICTNCLEPLPSYENDIDGSVICTSCYVTNLRKIKSIRCKSDDKSGIYIPLSNELITFVKSLDYYEGKIEPSIDKVKFYRKLDKYFDSIGVVTRDEAKNIKHDKRGRKKGTDVQKMITAIKLCKYNCYNEVYYICNDYWGWIPNNISDIRELCIEDRKEMQKEWNKIPIEERGRKSNIPIWLLVWFHLTNRGHECELQDFKLTTEIQPYISTIKMLCERCDNKDIQFMDD